MQSQRSGKEMHWPEDCKMRSEAGKKFSKQPQMPREAAWDYNP
jgi:hypothetical protein